MWLRFLGATLPLNFYLAAAIPRALRERDQGGMILYQSGFLFATLALFTISSAKRDDYILAALPSFAIVIASPFASDMDNRSAPFANGASVAEALLLLSLAVGGLIASKYPGAVSRTLGGVHSSDTAYANFLLTVARNRPLRASLTMLVVVGASTVSLGFAWKWRSRAAAFGIAAAELAVVSLWIGLFIPEFARQRTLKGFVLDAAKIVGNREVMIAGARNYEISYYFGHGVPAAPRHLTTAIRPGSVGYLFVWSQELDQIGADEDPIPGSVVLVSHPTSGHRRMLLVSLNK
jgi:hypothetical protein